MPRIAINGLGRMGKLVLRAFFERGAPGEIVLLNDAVGDPALHAHLFEFDSVHGRWPAAFAHDADSVSVSVNGTRMMLGNARSIAELPLRDFAIDLVLDCTGVFKTAAKTRAYFTQVKVFAWYDNEWGYACRLADVTGLVAGSL